MENKKYTLLDALKLINDRLPHLTVTSIEFEDGSMRKFIVGIKGYSKKSFMNMDTVEKYKGKSDNEFVDRFYQAAKTNMY